MLLGREYVLRPDQTTFEQYFWYSTAEISIIMQLNLTNSLITNFRIPSTARQRRAHTNIMHVMSRDTEMKRPIGPPKRVLCYVVLSFSNFIQPSPTFSNLLPPSPTFSFQEFSENFLRTDTWGPGEPRETARNSGSSVKKCEKHEKVGKAWKVFVYKKNK